MTYFFYTVAVRRKNLLRFLFLISILSSNALAEPITLYSSFAGTINFVTAGGTLRTSDDGGAPCNVTTGPVSANVSGIPGGSTIEAAYLYWAGSGATVDDAVTFNGTNITADRTFTDTFTLTGTDYPYFSGFKNVTANVTGNGSYSFNNLTVSNGAPWCASSAVLSGWALFVIYSNPSEDFRVINTFDGFQQFRGSSISLTPSNFTIPSSPINGKMAVVSWEGDVGNSASLGGFDEEIRFNGSILTNAANPSDNQFNSTINTYSAANDKYGVDIDTYDISSYISAGQTSATTIYSSGGDLVFLSAEIISVTNTPISDLSINKSHVGNFSVNTNGVYTIAVTNSGPMTTSGTTTVTDVLPAGLTFVSASGSGWTCGHAAGTVTCTRAAAIAVGVTAPAITLTVAVGNTAYPNVTNTASVTGGNFDHHAGDNSDSDPTTVLAPDLSSSIKDVVDLNGGEANIGDTLQYTITLDNTSSIAASATVVTDNIPANVTAFTVISTPVGSINSSTGMGTGANGTGYLNITNISVPANSTVTIVFNVIVAGSASPGTTIDNTATITPGAGVGAAPDAPTVIVSPSLVPSTGAKDLYIEINGGNRLTRVIPAIAASTPTVDGGGGVQTFLLNPVLAGPLTLAAGAIPITLRMTRNGTNTNRTVRVDLDYGNGGGGWIALGNQQQNLTMTTAGTYQTYNYSINLGANVTIPAGRDLRLRITNNTAQTNRRIIITNLNGGVLSRLRPIVNTVVNVDNVNFYTATYPNMTLGTSFAQGQTAYIRAVVSDPFGSADITSADITIEQSNGTPVVTGAAMTSVATTALTRIYQYPYTIPMSPLGGNWTAYVLAREGAENLITDDQLTAFAVEQANLTLVKSSSVISDPVNLTVNPKRIPGAVIQYNVVSSNSNRSSPNAATVVIQDPLPTQMRMCVSTICNGGSQPVVFTNGTPTSALTFNYATHVTYSNQVGGGPPFTYVPAPDVNGYDNAVTGIRIAPAGTMAASSGTPPHPSFTVYWRMQIK